MVPDEAPFKPGLTDGKVAADLASAAKELKADGDIISGDLTEEGAKKLQKFGPPDGEGPTVSDANGSVNSGSRRAPW